LWAGWALAGIAAGAGTIAWWSIQRQSTPIPVAVLPFENLNRAADGDYFSDGLTGELIRNLALIDGLAVRSQTSSFAFKGKSRNLRDAANQLQADYLLEGSVLRAGQRLRINVQLVRALDDSPCGRNDTTAWSRTCLPSRTRSHAP
jgi:TolB-like protein